jgi:hypothetical protein
MAKRMDSLARTLGNLLRARGLDGRLSEYHILGQWQKSVGAAIARHAQPVSLRGKKLYLSVDSPAWMQQLSLLKPVLIEKINGSLGRQAINDIALKLGEVESSERPQEEPVVLPPLSAEDRSRIEQYLEGIHDPEARDALRRVMEKDFQVKKGREKK